MQIRLNCSDCAFFKLTLSPLPLKEWIYEKQKHKQTTKQQKNKQKNKQKTKTKKQKKKGKKKNSNNGKIHCAKIWVNQFNYCSHTFIRIGDNLH